MVPSERLQLFEALSGLLKTAQLEHPGFTGQLIEMDGEEEGPSIVKKLEENAGCPMDDRIRYRDGNRWVMDWEEVQENGEEGHIPWKDRGVYWITGGLGGLGLIFAGEIVERVTEAVLILTGRSPLTEEKEAKLKQLEVRGARVAYRQVDVSCKEAVEELVVWIQEEFGGL
ncbi:KR domain-containing protein, partial [Paenibacillus alba]|nr:KR domain-containing protein [Paenibacillus alba]